MNFLTIKRKIYKRKRIKFKKITKKTYYILIHFKIRCVKGFHNAIMAKSIKP